MYTQHIILDFEMNPTEKGCTASRGLKREIIEIGAVKLNRRFEIVDRFSCFVKPQYSADINPYIVKLTGITSADVHKEKFFGEALREFSEWIGNGRTRIYSWSDSDLIQLMEECGQKEVEFPANMGRWIDFQTMYPRLMKIRNTREKMSLRVAAEWYGVNFDKKAAHRALYDAEVTANLVIPILTGEYKQQINCISQYLSDEEESVPAAFSLLGDLCKGMLDQFLQPLPSEPQFAG